VKESTASPTKCHLVQAVSAREKSRFFEEIRPGSIRPIDVVEIETGRLERLSEGDVGLLGTQCSQLGDFVWPTTRNRILDTL
jgi:hypothetical protein